MGITEDLNLQGDNYSWLGSIFYFGYLVGCLCLLAANLR
jgi:hypothetical protein